MVMVFIMLTFALESSLNATPTPLSAAGGPATSIIKHLLQHIKIISV